MLEKEPEVTSNLRCRTFARVACASTLALCALSAAALTDPVGDFLPTFTGPANADLDVVSSFVNWDPVSQTFTASGTMAGAIGTTAGASFIWGFDRGAGTERFVAGTPSTGVGVFFDSVLVLTGAGAGTINLLNGTPAVTLAPGSVQISGNTISATFAASLLPSNGRLFEQYGWNLWPRSGPGNAAISDFAPDASTPVVTTVPEPATWALLLAALPALAWVSRRRRGG